MRNLKLTAPLCLSLVLAACTISGKSVSEMGKVDYKAGAKQRPDSLEVPPDLTSPGRDDRYYIEGESSTATLSEYQKGGAKAGTGAPGGQALEVLPDMGGMKIGRAGNERWLIVPGSAQQLWPRVRQFWLDSGFALVVDRPEIGVMETDWLENRAAIKQDFIRDTLGKVFEGMYTSPEKDKYRTRLERGAEAGTVEIYISHRGLEEELVGAQKDSSVWAWRKPDPGLEAEMLRRLMVALGAQEDRARELLANSEPTDKARFERAPDGGAALIFAEGFDQSWRQIGLALDRTGFLVEDRDRTLGLYDVQSSSLKQQQQGKNAANDESWWSKLKFWGKTDEPKQPEGTVVLQPGQSYRIFVKGDDKKSTVRVLDKDGNIDKGEEANKILKLLFDQIK
jgi:outer membrane protein assembly factor BamC